MQNFSDLHHIVHTASVCDVDRRLYSCTVCSIAETLADVTALTPAKANLIVGLRMCC